MSRASERTKGSSDEKEIAVYRPDGRQPAQDHPESATAPNRILQFQRAAGNQAVVRLLESRNHFQNRSDTYQTRDDYSGSGLHAIQSKLTSNQLGVQRKQIEVSAPTDSAEKEADEVARKVVAGQSAKVRGTTGTISRKSEGSTETTPEFQSKLESSKGNGQFLDDSTRSEMESQMGTDFRDVRIHTGREADNMSESIGARAFTLGSDIYFRQGEFPSDATQKKTLLAHELTHTVQQKGIQRTIQRQHLDERRDRPPFADKTLDQELEDLKTGKYNDDPQAKYRAARKVLIASYANQVKLTPAEQQSLIVMVAEGEKAPDSQQNVKDQNVTSSQTNTTEGYSNRSADSDVQRALREKLEKIKCGEYGNDQQAEYDAARELLTSDLIQHFSLTSSDRQLLVGLVAGKSRASDPNVLAPNIAPALSCKIKTKYTTEDVRKAAWNIVQGEQSVKDAFLFFSQIKANVVKEKWAEELAKFFTGKYQPRTRIKDIGTSGETPPQSGPLKHKKIKLNRRNSFSLAVSTYLHEIAHYADMWYSSMAAKIRGKYRPMAELGTGIRAGKTDLPKSEQVKAMGESLTSTIKQILIDMQKPKPQPNEHHRVPALRLRYNEAKNVAGFQNDVFVKEIAKELTDAAVSKYEAWGAKVTGDKMTGRKIELGFAFEKAAYGFYSQQSKEGEWAISFNEKFEKKYCKYLQ